MRSMDFEEPLKSALIFSYTVEDFLPGHFDLLVLLILSVLSVVPSGAVVVPKDDAFLEARGSLAAGVPGSTT